MKFPISSEVLYRFIGILGGVEGMIKVAINGFGRIGRNTLRAALAILSMVINLKL